MTLHISEPTTKRPKSAYGFHLQKVVGYPILAHPEREALAMYGAVVGVLDRIVDPRTQSFAIKVSTSPYMTDIQLVVEPWEKQEEPSEAELQEEQLQVLLLATQQALDEIVAGCHSIVRTIDAAMGDTREDENA